MHRSTLAVTRQHKGNDMHRFRTACLVSLLVAAIFSAGIARATMVNATMGNAAIVNAAIIHAPGIRQAAADSAAIEPFLGRYEGRTIKGDGDGQTTTRDLDVTIEPGGEPGHFRVAWSTIIRRPDGEPKRKAYTILFKPTQRPGIYASAMRMNMFGNPVPHDPLKGDPYVWSRIAGRTLTVYALSITDDGGYDLQVYDRTLRDGGLDLTFTRLDEGEAPVVVKAVLERIAP